MNKEEISESAVNDLTTPHTENIGDANGNDAQIDHGATTMISERRLVFRFLGLSYSRIVKIAAALDLI